MAAVLPLLLILVVGALSPSGFCLPSISTAPAFLWSPNYNDHWLQASVNYQTLSPKDLAKSVLSEGGWSNLLCSESKVKQPVDLALVFVGRELQSSDIYANKNADKDLVNRLKVSFTTSNFSMAFPYIAASEDETLVDSLLAGFTEMCGRDVGLSNVAFSESCSLTSGNFPKLSNLQSVHDYLASRMEKRAKGEADVVVFCHEGSNSLNELHQPRLEGETFAELVNSMDQSGEKYAVLYVSDPFKSIQYPSYREVERFLQESTNSTGCGEVCKIKSSLLEGLLVGIVLLIILISGICCMMGIDTPTRFEAPQDS
ncbi:hypothetical protein L484_005157 [Morus notabilis]|uniref:V-type proton ATPase subunit S1/VOA1 transmembrane domain-containing protein n=2 Tax=Morus notabilis TaxID=981085 RepID=W9R0N4_9ROSA|nr:uncharacterized protein LOC21388636 isoform X2 [Morus notabilis]XP_024019213.1 uncharacterized protein LOC21388636 isoform X2 [Morus notabilis]XP_024019214.1 uncharacterized protein LOC21388636 isoform X2 [Morus notabilis]EXB53607.1 hypothetical protein L484_005157 [Morus notabilis]